ncbi:tetratricopeptide repeat protein [Streptomyces sp. NPDC013178]|uniref:phosphorylase family protein n=1 Tax=Streptomyces sp. NPDC013178 TaxID=3155118 RepID=UPI0033F2322D
MADNEQRPIVVILTALLVEYEAVRAHLTEIRKVSHPLGTRFDRGRLPGTDWSVALAQTGEGNGAAAVITERAHNWLAPDALLFVGVAGGLKDDIELGDVVVATHVYGYHGGKVTDDGFRARPRAWEASHRLVQAARHARFGPELSGRVHFKPVVAGEVVLNSRSSTLSEQLKHYYDDAVAIEMESAGVAQAAHLTGCLHTLTIRGISDKADGQKRAADASGSQERAAANAAAAAVAVLAEVEPKEAVAGKAENHHGRGPVPVATASLPAAPSGFTGRGAELEELLDALRPAPDRGRTRWFRLRNRAERQPRSPVLISAVSGMGGIGKTALALHVAHKARANGWFPGGTLFVDMRGYDAEPVTAEQAVTAFLEALGVRNDDLPGTAQAQSGLFRSLLSERAEQQGPMFLLLDNVSRPEQIAPLLPGTDRHRVLITSRDRLSSLPAQLIALQPLSPDEAADLVTEALLTRDKTDNRPAQEPEALRELAVLCGRLPVALQIAAAQLSHRRTRPIASLVDDIRAASDRIGALESKGVDQYNKPLALRPIFEVSYSRLPEDQARMLRLLALAPTAETSTVALMYMAELTHTQSIALLEELAAAHLVTQVGADTMRWRMHDLVREYVLKLTAAQTALAEDGEAARERILKFYFLFAQQAGNWLSRLKGTPVPMLFSGRGEALLWLDAERPNLVSAAHWAAQERHAATAIQHALSLSRYLGWRRAFDDLVTVSAAAQKAAQRMGDLVREAMAGDNLGIALRETGQVQLAIDAHTRARDLFQTTGNRNREAMAWNNLGTTMYAAGRMQDAIEAHTRARDLHHATGDRNNEAMAWSHLGNALDEVGRTQDAMDALVHACDLFKETGDLNNEAMTWSVLGVVLRKAGRVREAIGAYANALKIHAAFDNWYGTGTTLSNLAVAHSAEGDTAKARTRFREAAAAYLRADATAEAAVALARSRMSRRQLRRLTRSASSLATGE